MCENPIIFYYDEFNVQRFLKSRKGLHQYDHLSPYLFILMEEVLTCMLKKNFENRKFAHFFHLQGYWIVSHLLYANDMLLFVNGEKLALKKILKTLKIYEELSV